MRASIGAGLSLAAALLAAGAAQGEDPAGPRDAGQEIRVDGGVCRVHPNAMPSVGYGCHVHWEEPGQGGSSLDVMAPLRCGQSIRVCGEERPVHLPAPVSAPPPRGRRAASRLPPLPRVRTLPAGVVP